MTDNNTALKKAGLKVTLPRLKILEVLQGQTITMSVRKTFTSVLSTWAKKLGWQPFIVC
ncbi:Ferric uptake regulation protein FUR [Enterobacter cancerogenus]|uniref:Ferric uptake regulation protein FUR n=1 Tax=Enterobacter cancerogenus TaxID=69218 RepID=A0A484WYI5_9ENTR|nr:Ferric uptake regulation protein FUR [Enterobacter cancerogenus]